MVTLATPEVVSPARVRRMEIIGVFGSGKTTLAKRLTATSGSMLAEDHTRNPFWGDPRAIGALGYLGYDLSFLLQHAHLVSTAASDGIALCDWSFATDWLWASKRLDRDLPIYESVHRSVLQKLGPPAGYLFLRQKPETVLERLARRSRPAEGPFRDYVRSACEYVEELAANLPGQRVLVVDDNADPSGIERWVDQLPEEEMQDD